MHYSSAAALKSVSNLMGILKQYVQKQKIQGNSLKGFFIYFNYRGGLIYSTYIYIGLARY